jgi:hypothetical protein
MLAPLLSSRCATCTVNLILLEYISQITFSVRYRTWSFSLYCLLYPLPSSL